MIEKICKIIQIFSQCTLSEWHYLFHLKVSCTETIYIFYCNNYCVKCRWWQLFQLFQIILLYFHSKIPLITWDLVVNLFQNFKNKTSILFLEIYSSVMFLIRFHQLLVSQDEIWGRFVQFMSQMTLCSVYFCACICITMI